MEYVKLGRKLGIGTRVAAKILRERARNAPVSAPKTPSVEKPQQARPSQRPLVSQVDPRATARKVTRGVVRGSRGFGRGFWNSFAHAIRALWHEITGVFFAIFALFFGQSMWRVRGDWEAGPQHHRFEAYLIFMLVFAYFSVTAFVFSRRSPR